MAHLCCQLFSLWVFLGKHWPGPGEIIRPIFPPLQPSPNPPLHQFTMMTLFELCCTHVDTEVFNLVAKTSFLSAASGPPSLGCGLGQRGTPPPADAKAALCSEGGFVS